MIEKNTKTFIAVKNLYLDGESYITFRHNSLN